jgi:hypothetical protein
VKSYCGTVDLGITGVDVVFGVLVVVAVYLLSVGVKVSVAFIIFDIEAVEPVGLAVDVDVLGVVVVDFVGVAVLIVVFGVEDVFKALSSFVILDIVA